MIIDDNEKSNGIQRLGTYSDRVYAIPDEYPTAISRHSVEDRTNLPLYGTRLIHRQPVGESRASVMRNDFLLRIFCRILYQKVADAKSFCPRRVGAIAMAA